VRWPEVCCLLTLLTAGCAAPRGPVRDGLVVSWDARRVAAGRLVRDGSGCGNDARLTGAARLADGPARIELGEGGALVGLRPIRPERITVEAVFRADRVDGPLQLIVSGFPPAAPVRDAKGNPRQWVMEIRGHPPQEPGQCLGHLDFGIFGEDQRWHLAQSNAPLGKGWRHAIGTFDGRRVRLYLDGRLQGRTLPQQPFVYEGTMHVPPDGVIRLPAAGANAPSDGFGLEGAIALVRIYDRALTAEEIAQNVRAASAPLPALAARVATRMKRAKPPFRVLFSNDTTNILTCVSPYHKKGEPFTAERLRATADEVAGADVHMLQPGLGWIPWWKSTEYPADDHARWWMEWTGLEPDSFNQFMLDGGDMVQVFVDRCRRKRQPRFVSLRLNDGHHLEHVGRKHRMSIWQHVLNWAVPEVRAHKLAFIREICEQYDLDGFELDFMRHTSLFRPSETTSGERSAIVTAFVAEVRKILDTTAEGGRRRWLCARVPALLSRHDRLGIDLPAMVDAGLDMVNLSAYYFTQQHHDLAAIREMVPDAALYLEMTHCTTIGPSRGGYDSFVYRRTTDQQFHTTAHVAYRRGADGVSLFNFVYYREHGTPGRGPFNEPPFHVLERLGDPAWLARQPQWYVLAKARHAPLPKRFAKGQTQALTLDMAPTEHQTKDGLLRLMTQEDSSGCTWAVAANGVALKPTAFVRKPLDHPYEGGLGQPNQYACFICPRAVVRDGRNELSITLTAGGPATVNYLDVTLP